MKNLGNLSPALGSNKSNKRLGRGIGSGLGKTAGKGHKGQRARKSGGIRPGFEGGQTPLYRRIPKHGFSTDHKATVFSIVNTEDLMSFADGEVVSKDSLLAKGLIKTQKYPVKILAKGTLSKKNLTVLAADIAKMSKTSRAILEGLGAVFKES